MIHLILNDDAVEHSRQLPFFLAMEEWAARTLPPDEYFFTWSVEPTVIVGRNQDLNSEVDRDYCLKRGIRIVRRRSGGGCVYADRDNLMLSYVSPRVDVMGTFRDYTDRICLALKSLGVESEVSGRNDITIEGKKVSGTAFYHLPGRSIVHGTMLFDTNLENMVNAITPSRAKLESKKVKSVESRITTLRRYLPDLTVDRLRRALIESVTSRERVLTREDVKAIEEIEKGYYSPKWLERGRSSRPTVHIDGVGEIALTLRLNDDGRIDGLDIDGDPFVIGDVGVISSALAGAVPDHESLSQRLAGIDTSRFISGLTTERFIELSLN